MVAAYWTWYVSTEGSLPRERVLDVALGAADDLEREEVLQDVGAGRRRRDLHSRHRGTTGSTVTSANRMQTCDVNIGWLPRAYTFFTGAFFGAAFFFGATFLATTFFAGFFTSFLTALTAFLGAAFVAFATFAAFLGAACTTRANAHEAGHMHIYPQAT